MNSAEPNNQEHREFPLTYPQREVWYLEKINPLSGIGNIACTLKADQVLDRKLTNEAVNLLLQENEGFRIRIRENPDGSAVQYFAPYEPYEIDYFDFSKSGEDELFHWDRVESRRPFSSFDQNLFYFALIQVDNQTSRIFARIHHLITDAWSFVQIGNELMAHYQRLSEGGPIVLKANPSYRDYIESEKQYIDSDRYRLDQDFWRNQFNRPPVLTTLKSRTGERIGLGAKRKSFSVPEKLTQQIREYCQVNRTSIFALFFAAMSIYINRVKDQEDITIGTPVLNRTNAREKKTVGMFISTVPLRVHIDSELSFVEFSHHLDQAWFSVLKHQKYPYHCLIRDVRDEHPDVDRLYDIAISYQNARLDKSDSTLTREVRWHFNEFQSESLFLHINDREGDNQILLNYDYQTDLFYSREIDYIHDHLIRLLWHALDNPQRKISQIHMLSQKETRKVIEMFNQTDAEYPRQATIASLFEACVDRAPDAIAVETGASSVTYEVLDQLAEAVARRLRLSGVGRESLVGLLLTPSVTMIAAILGVIKAGGAYLPLDPDYPQDRISFMLQDSAAPVVLAAANTSCPADYTGEIIDVTAIVNQTLQIVREGFRLPRQPQVNQPEDLLYVIYTSGSTGRPKGAMIEHRNVVRLLFNDKNLFDFGPQDTWTMFHSYCFDFSVWEMYGALLNGSRLVMVPKSVARDTNRFRQLLADKKVTILSQTPAAFYNLTDTEARCQNHDLSVRMVIFGGDALKPALLRRFHQAYPDTRLINMYGITETTVHVTFLELTDNDLQTNVSNVGRPIPTMRVYILDSRLNPVPIGIPGEICVSGAGVGRGYLNNPELTAARFIPNPFVPGETLYRSGDLARFFAQGDIEYLGRIDHQVKIRGHRIELGEIETAILNFGPIREVRVLTRDQENGNKQLIAYIVPAEPFEMQALRVSLERSLPDYMVPPYLVAIDSMPLNSNGKIAREHLPEPGAPAIRQVEYVPPQNDLQQIIADIFAEVLELPQVGIYDHFFHLGGDSLSAVRVISSLGESVSFADLYAHPTVSELAEHMGHQAIEGCRIGFLIRLTAKSAANHLIVFPFGGGSAASYLEFANQFEQINDRFDIFAVNLPDERLDHSIMANRLADEISQTLDGEISFYSHCAGTSLALATALILEKRGFKITSCFVGASLSPVPNLPVLTANTAASRGAGKPWLVSVMRVYENLAFNPWRYLSDKMVLKVLNLIGLPTTVLETDDLWPTMLKIFRTDARQFYEFFSLRQSQSAPAEAMGQLSCPIHCIVGQHDPITSGARRKYKRWRQFSPAVDFTEIPGAGHYFLSKHADLLAHLVVDTLVKDEEVQNV